MLLYVLTPFLLQELSFTSDGASSSTNNGKPDSRKKGKLGNQHLQLIHEPANDADDGFDANAMDVDIVVPITQQYMDEISNGDEETNNGDEETNNRHKGTDDSESTDVEDEDKGAHTKRKTKFGRHTGAVAVLFDTVEVAWLHLSKSGNILIKKFHPDLGQVFKEASNQVEGSLYISNAFPDRSAQHKYSFFITHLANAAQTLCCKLVYDLLVGKQTPAKDKLLYCQKLIRMVSRLLFCFAHAHNAFSFRCTYVAYDRAFGKRLPRSSSRFLVSDAKARQSNCSRASSTCMIRILWYVGSESPQQGQDLT